MERSCHPWHEFRSPQPLPGVSRLMAKILARMAQSALGTAPVVMPVDRPLFARQHAPGPLTQLSNLEAEESRDSWQEAISIPAAQPRTPEIYRSHPMDGEPEAQDHASRPAYMPEPGVGAKRGSPIPAPPERPTLRQVIDQIFAPRESEANARKAPGSARAAETREAALRSAARVDVAGH